VGANRMHGAFASAHMTPAAIIVPWQQLDPNVSHLGPVHAEQSLAQQVPPLITPLSQSGSVVGGGVGVAVGLQRRKEKK
jgi:hypothetical protein